MSTNPWILLIEDDLKLGKYIKSYLEQHDFQVEWLTNGSAVSTTLTTNRYDLVLLDIMLPGKNGFEICHEIRPLYTGPIVMLTAQSGDLEQIKGLDAGADDYIDKPFEPLVLLARIKMHLRRYQATKQPAPKQEMTFGPLKIDQISHTVQLDGERIPFTEAEFNLLNTLALNHDRIMSREELFQTLLGRPYDGLDRTLDGRISRVRKKLDCSQDKPRFIKAIRGQGYLFFSKSPNEAE